MDRLEKTLKDGNQSMIFLNRRGFASFMICKKCGKVMKCDDCDVSLTWHKEDNLLKCEQGDVPERVLGKHDIRRHMSHSDKMLEVPLSMTASAETENGFPQIAPNSMLLPS